MAVEVTNNISDLDLRYANEGVQAKQAFITVRQKLAAYHTFAGKLYAHQSRHSITNFFVFDVFDIERKIGVHV